MASTIGVSIVRCTSYEKEKLIAAIDRIFDHFGGIHTIIKKGSRVLLKPNLLKESETEECIITHP
ncbi:MAG: hypothetical protein KGJ87_08295 [Planctomycetota bacterium]|nr:hypothetical protein [Planctomycetota bacterium]